MNAGVQTERIFRKIIPSQICLEKGAHLSVPRPRTVKNQEMDLKRKHENQDGYNDEAKYPGTPMFRLFALQKMSVARY